MSLGLALKRSLNFPVNRDRKTCVLILLNKLTFIFSKMVKKKPSSFAEQLAELSNPAPSLDPEDTLDPGE